MFYNFRKLGFIDSFRFEELFITDVLTVLLLILYTLIKIKTFGKFKHKCTPICSE